jgi:hypothetical protein
VTEEILTAVIRLNEAESCIIAVGGGREKRRGWRKEGDEREQGVCRRQSV